MGGPDDDVGHGGSDADLDAGIALLSQLALEEFVQLGIEDTVCGDMLARVQCAQIPSILRAQYLRVANCAQSKPR